MKRLALSNKNLSPCLQIFIEALTNEVDDAQTDKTAASLRFIEEIEASGPLEHGAAMMLPPVTRRNRLCSTLCSICSE